MAPANCPRVNAKNQYDQYYWSLAILVEAVKLRAFAAVQIRKKRNHFSNLRRRQRANRDSRCETAVNNKDEILDSWQGIPICSSKKAKRSLRAVAMLSRTDGG
jgi:hypothetical protein